MTYSATIALFLLSAFAVFALFTLVYVICKR